MKFLLLAALVVGATARIVPVSLYGPASARIEGEYLVQFGKDPASIKAFEGFKSKARSMDPKSIVMHEFSNYRGFWAKLSEDQLAIVQQVEGIETIEPNVRGEIFGEQSPATWGIDRSDQRTLPLNNIYRWRDNAAGQGVGVYVLDTGIFTDHPDFNGRASFLADCYSLFGAPCNTAGTSNDPQGHGTHCAGTVGSTLFGIAKNSTLFSLRTFSSLGTGTPGGVINAIQFAVNHNFNGVKIMSMSFGFPPNTALNNAVDAAFDAGILSVVAAGNGNDNNCNGSPQAAASAVIVSASDQNDRKASFSSFGPCVDIWAPGVGITSLARNGGTTVNSGTSMATPHVAGAAALIASRGITDPGQIKTTLVAESTPDVITGVPTGTVNRLLFTSPQ